MAIGGASAGSTSIGPICILNDEDTINRGREALYPRQSQCFSSWLRLRPYIYSELETRESAR
jgi:hypothetical protein